MIPTIKQSEIKTFGDIQQNQVGIDPRNLEHIVTLLSTNLYSRPEESFLRETVCNAVDSHAEAGTKDPIILSFVSDKFGDNIVSIRDYGTGISPERFQNIYLNIGSSTKRDSNDFIGSFGIGRFSALACADTVHITSFYNGIAYYYLMMKDSAKIKIDKISEIPTTEHNGVEVKIQVDSLENYVDALPYLYYIPNLYVNYQGNDDYHSYKYKSKVDTFNERKIHHHINFSMGFVHERWNPEHHILLGKVLYKLDGKKQIFDSKYEKLFLKIQPRFDITELNITPNREALLYSERTIKALKKKYDDIIKELSDICKQSPKDLDNIFKYYHFMSKDASILLDDIVLPVKGTSLESDVAYTYKGKKLKENWSMWHGLSNLCDGTLNNPFALCIISNGVYFKEKEKRKKTLESLLYNSKDSSEKLPLKFILIPEAKGVKGPIVKSYLSQKYNKSGTYIFIVVPADNSKLEDDFSTSPYKALVQGTDYTDHKGTLELLGYIKDSIKQDSETLDIANSADFIQYKKSISREALAAKNFDKTIRVYIKNYYDSDSYTSGWLNHYDVNSIADAEHKVGEKNKKIVYGDRENPLFRLFDELFSTKKKAQYSLVMVAKTNVRYLKDSPGHWIPIENLINEDTPEIKQLITWNQFRIHVNELNKKIMYCILPHIPEQEAKYLEIALTYYPRIKREDLAIINQFVEKFEDKGTQYDYDMIQGYKLVEKYNNIAEGLHGLFNLCSNGLYAFLYMAMKSKFFRLRFGTYKEIKYRLNDTL